MNFSPSQQITAMLSQYIKFDPNQLSIGLWSGDLSLANVSFQHDAFESQGFSVVASHIGSMKVNIPWTTLMISKATVELSDVTIVVSPTSLSTDTSRAYLPSAAPAGPSSASSTSSQSSAAGAPSPTASAPAPPPASAPSFVERMQASVKSTLLTRLMSNLHMSLSRLNVAVLQDEVSVGFYVARFIVDNDEKGTFKATVGGGGAAGPSTKGGKAPPPPPDSLSRRSSEGVDFPDPGDEPAFPSDATSTSKSVGDIKKRVVLEEFGIFVKLVTFPNLDAKKADKKNRASSTSSGADPAIAASSTLAQSAQYAAGGKRTFSTTGAVAGGGSEASRPTPLSLDYLSNCLPRFTGDNDEVEDDSVILKNVTVSTLITLSKNVIDGSDKPPAASASSPTRPKAGSRDGGSSPCPPPDSPSATPPTPLGPKFAFLCHIHRLAFVLSTSHCRLTCSFLSALSRVKAGRPLHRPLDDSSPPPRFSRVAVHAWWHYSFRAVVTSLRLRRGRLSVGKIERLFREYKETLEALNGARGLQASKWHSLGGNDTQHTTSLQKKLTDIEHNLELSQVSAFKVRANGMSRHFDRKHELLDKWRASRSAVGKELHGVAALTSGALEKASLSRTPPKKNPALKQELSGDAHFDLVAEEIREQIRREGGASSQAQSDPFSFSFEMSVDSSTLTLAIPTSALPQRPAKPQRSGLSDSDSDLSEEEAAPVTWGRIDMLGEPHDVIFWVTAGHFNTRLINTDESDTRADISLQSLSFTGKNDAHLMSLTARSAFECVNHPHLASKAPSSRPAVSGHFRMYKNSLPLTAGANCTTPTKASKTGGVDSASKTDASRLKGSGSQCIRLEVHLSEVVVTPDAESVVALQIFAAAMSSASFPKSPLPPLSHDYVRNLAVSARRSMSSDFVAETLAAQPEISIAFVCEGFELLIPVNAAVAPSRGRSFSIDFDDFPVFDLETPAFLRFATGKASARSGALHRAFEVSKTFKQKLFKSRSKVSDSSVSDESTSDSRKQGSGSGPTSERAAIAVQDLQERMFRKTHIAASAIVLDFLDIEGNTSPNLAIMRSALDVKAVVSECLVPGLKGYPSKRLELSAGSADFLISETRAKGFAGVKEFLSTLTPKDEIPIHEYPSSSTEPKEQLPPRSQLLVGHVEFQAHVEFEALQFSIVADEENITLPQRVFLAEECVADFLSHRASFHILKGISQKSMETSRKLFSDRLRCIGVPDDRISAVSAETIAIFDAKVEEVKRYAEEQNRKQQFPAPSSPTLSPSSSISPLPIMSKRPTMGILMASRFSPKTRLDNTADEMTPDANELDERDGLRNDADDPGKASSEEDSDGASSVSSSESSSNGDIVEAAIHLTAEHVVGVLRDLLKTSSFPVNRELVVMELKNPSCEFLQLVYDRRITHTARSLSIRNGGGVVFIKFEPEPRNPIENPPLERKNSTTLRGRTPSVGSSADCSRPAAAVDAGFSGIYKQQRAPLGIHFSDIEQDIGHNFAAGGSSTIDLTTKEISKPCRTERKRRVHKVLAIGRCDIVCCPRALDDALAIFSTLSALRHRGDDVRAPRSAPPRRAIPDSLDAEISTLSVVMTSNELQPFSLFEFENFVVEQSHPIDSPVLERTRASSCDFRVYNLTPEGEAYPSIISPIIAPQSKEGGEPETVPFFLEMLRHNNMWAHPSRMQMKFTKVNVTVLYRWVSEILQYALREDQHLGLFIKNYFGDPILDSVGNPAPPLLWSIHFKDSEVVLPRNSSSLDLVAIVVDDLNVCNSFEDESFTVPTTPLSNGCSAPVVPDIPPSNPSLRSRRPSVLSSLSRSVDFGPASSSGLTEEDENDDFHDAFDDFENMVVSSFSSKLIPRTTVQLSNVRLMTATGATLGDGVSDVIVELLSRQTLNAIGVGQRVYAESPDPSTAAHRHVWRELTTNPAQLEVCIDYNPHRRVLLSDFITNSIGGPLPPATPFSLEASQSQLYLLLSIYYSNMQELPMMFPYTEKEIRESATYPAVPDNWPEYGTDDWVRYMKQASVALRTETLLRFKQLKLGCGFDSTYFKSQADCIFMCQQQESSSPPPPLFKGPRVELTDALIHICGDKEGLLKIGGGATSLAIGDDRDNPPFTIHRTSLRCGKESVLESHIAQHTRNRNTAAAVYSAQEETSPNPHHSLDASNSDIRVSSSTFESWVDLYWGLDCGRHTLLKPLPQPFNLSLFMTPDSWCHVNVGLDRVDGVVKDLAPIWMLLDYFGCYFRKAEFGNPGFTAEKLRDNAIRRSKARNGSPCSEESVRDPCLNLDIRLWMNRPHLVLPDDALDLDGPHVLLESEAGVFYRYNTIGYDLFFQEASVKDLAVVLMKNYMTHRESRGKRGMSGAGKNVCTIVDKLSLYFSQMANNKTKYSDMVIRVPLTPEEFLDQVSREGIESSVSRPKPLIVPTPTAVSPPVNPDRDLGLNVCDVVASLEELNFLGKVLGGFLGPVKPADPTAEPAPGLEEETPYSTIYNLSDIRLFIVDPVLGMHLPVVKVCLRDCSVSLSKLLTYDDDAKGTPSAYQVGVDVHLWAEYFNNTLKCWEPLLEPYIVCALYEKCPQRGTGVTLRTDCPLHLNVTGALFDTIDDVLKSIDVIVNKKSRSKTVCGAYLTRERVTSDAEADFRSSSVRLNEEVKFCGIQKTVTHEDLPSLPRQERVAFSLVNLTGQRIRFHQSTKNQVSTVANLKYMRHATRARLQFDATMTLVANRGIVEVPFDVQQERDATHNVSSGSFQLDGGNDFTDHKGRSRHRDRFASNGPVGRSESIDYNQGRRLFSGRIGHSVDIQVSGFKWMGNIPADTLGMRFEDIISRTPSVAEKVERDWRLGNACKLLTDVSPFNGGRQLTIRSVFRVHNKTGHALLMAVHPDPSETPMHTPASANTTGKFRSQTVSQRLLRRPATVSFDDTNKDQSASDVVEEVDVSEYQRIAPGEKYNVPLLLLDQALRYGSDKEFHLGSLWFRPDENSSNSKSLFSSLMNSGPSASTRENCTIKFSSRPVQLAQIVYETSKLYEEKVKNKEETDADFVGEGVQISCAVEHSQKDVSVDPFCYCLEVKRSKLQKKLSAIAKAATSEGRKPVQSNQGTHLDSGAVDEEGNEDYRHGPVSYTFVLHPPITIENLLPVAGRFELMHAVKKKVVWWGDVAAGGSVPVHTVGLDAPLLLLMNLGFCRTVTGEGALVHDGVVIRGSVRARGKEQGSGKKEEGAISSGIGKIIEGIGLGSEGIATETTVIDSQGQKLVLRIENQLGGGGQRKVTVYCPFWIINTTPYALRYKQEGKSSLVSGTCTQGKDGSLPVDESANTQSYRKKQKEHSHAIEHSDASEKREEKPAPSSSSSRQHRKRSSKSARVLGGTKESTIFSGKVGALFTGGAEEFGDREYEILTSKELPLSRLSNLAFMFNYNDQNVLSLGQQKMCVQYYEPSLGATMCSDWSQGFSLEAIGVAQILSMPCIGGRALEVSLSISLAPGKLKQFTKIIRFSPRFVVVNMLNRPLKLWQDSSLLHSSYAHTKELKLSALSGSGDRIDVPPELLTPRNVLFGVAHDSDLEYAKGKSLFGSLSQAAQSTTLPKGTINNNAHFATFANSTYKKMKRTGHFIARVERNGGFCPFFLPDVRADRQLRIDFSSDYNVSSSFPADSPGEYFLKMTPPIDPTSFDHVATRHSAEYEVVLPPREKNWNGELGVWFETDWDHNGVIVKACKKDKFAFKQSDIHAGDILLAIDGEDQTNCTFDQVMEKLKSRLKVLKENMDESVFDQLASFDDDSTGSSLRGGGAARSADSLMTTGYDIKFKMILKFRTFEERMKLVRSNAFKMKRNSSSMKDLMTLQDRLRRLSEDADEESQDGDEEGGGIAASRDLKRQVDDISIKVEMNYIGHSLIMFVKPIDEISAPYRIHNNSPSNTIYVKQRNCDGHPWTRIDPGKSVPYIWEEPMKPPRLGVRVGASRTFLHTDIPQLIGVNEMKQKKRRQRLFGLVDNEFQREYGATKTIKLDEIGFTEKLPRPGKEDESKSLFCRVEADGGTRVLKISLYEEGKADNTTITTYLKTINSQIDELTRISKALIKLRNRENNNEKESPDAFEAQLSTRPHRSSSMQVTFPAIFSGKGGAQETGGEKSLLDRIRATDTYISGEENDVGKSDGLSIFNTNQIFVQVMEAAGLRANNLSGLSDPFCEVYVKNHKEGTIKKIRSENLHRRTYYVDKTLNPKWVNQCFILEVPPEAVESTRDYSVRVRIKDFNFLGSNSFLGQADVHLHNLIDEAEVRSPDPDDSLGAWYPLTAKATKMFHRSSNDEVTGSVKLRLQWIHSAPELLKYRIKINEEKLKELQSAKKSAMKIFYEMKDPSNSSKSKNISKTRSKSRSKRKAPKQLTAAVEKVDSVAAAVAEKFRALGARDNKPLRRPTLALSGALGGFQKSLKDVTAGSSAILNMEKIGKRGFDSAEDSVRRMREVFGNISQKKSPGLVAAGKASAPLKLTVTELFKRVQEKTMAPLSPRSGRSGNISKHPVSESKEPSRMNSPALSISRNSKTRSAFSEAIENTIVTSTSQFHTPPSGSALTRGDSWSGGEPQDDFDDCHADTFTSVGGSAPHHPIAPFSSNSSFHSPYTSNARGESCSLFYSNDTGAFHSTYGSHEDETVVFHSECRDSMLESVSGTFGDPLNDAEDLLVREYAETARTLGDKGLLHGAASGHIFHECHSRHKGLKKEVMARGKLSLLSFANLTDATVWLNSRKSCDLFKYDRIRSSSSEFPQGSASDFETDADSKAKEEDDAVISNLKVNYSIIASEELNQAMNTIQFHGSLYPRYSRILALETATRLAASRTSFGRAAERTVRSVKYQKGKLTIRPLAALNLPKSATHVYVTVKYSQPVRVDDNQDPIMQSVKSEKADARVAPKWRPKQEEKVLPVKPAKAKPKRLSKLELDNPLRVPNETEAKELSDPNSLSIIIEQISGSIHLSVMGEQVVGTDDELGKLVISVASCLDCVREHAEDEKKRKRDLKKDKEMSSDLDSLHDDDEMYVRWFPLLSAKDCISIEGDGGVSSKPHDSEKLVPRDDVSNPAHFYAPCIKLALKWEECKPKDEISARKKESDDRSNSKKPKIDAGVKEGSGIRNYCLVSLGSLSASLIDNARSLELLTLSICNVEALYSDSVSEKNMLLNIGWIQLDHQLSDAQAPVVLAPTPVVNLQPTLQVAIKQDNLGSKSGLYSFELVKVLLQELDIKVEECIFLAVFKFATDCLRRRKLRSAYRNEVETHVDAPGVSSCSDFASDLKSSGSLSVRRAGRQFVPPKSDGAERSSTVIQAATESGRFHSDRDLSPTAADVKRASGERGGVGLAPEKAAPEGEAFTKRKMYIERLCLESIKINLSYLKSSSHKRHDDESRPSFKSLDDPLAELIETESSSGMQFTDDEDEIGYRNLLHTLVSILPSLSEVPVRLNGKEIDHVFKTVEEITSSLQEYYVTETLRQVYKVLGSMDFMGNPYQLVNNLGTGVRDFFYEPAQAIFRGDAASIGIGVVRGTLSLVSHTTHGVFSFAHKLSNQVGKEVAQVTMDEDFKRRRAQISDMYAQSASEGPKRVRTAQGLLIVAFRPFHDLFYGVYKGATGIITEPYRGARKNGARGFVEGVAIGVMGVVAKPIVGLADAFAHASEGFRDVASNINFLDKQLERVKRRRLPYVFGLDERLIPYNYVNSRGMLLLNNEKNAGNSALGDLTSKDVLVDAEVLHLGAGLDVYVLASTSRICVFELQREENGSLYSKLNWSCSLDPESTKGGSGNGVSVQIVNRGHNGIDLHLVEGPQVQTRRLSIRRRDGHTQSTRHLARQGSSDNSVQSEKRKMKGEVFGKPLDSLDMFEESVKSSPGLGNVVGNAVGVGAVAVGGVISDIGAALHVRRAKDTVSAIPGRKVKVSGEVEHRPQLIRIHNAVCCLLENYQDVMRENGLGPEGKEDGITKFGSWRFIPSVDNSFTSSGDELCSLLEFATWGARHHDEESDDVMRDEKLSAAEDGGPKWIVRAHARAMFVRERFIPIGLPGDDDVAVKCTDELLDGHYTKEVYDKILADHAKWLRENGEYDSAKASGSGTFVRRGSSFSGTGRDRFQSAVSMEIDDSLDDAGQKSSFDLRLDSSSSPAPSGRTEQNSPRAAAFSRHKGSDVVEVVENRGLTETEHRLSSASSSRETGANNSYDKSSSKLSSPTRLESPIGSPNSSLSSPAPRSLNGGSSTSFGLYAGLPASPSQLSSAASIASTDSVLGERLEKVEFLLGELIRTQSASASSTSTVVAPSAASPAPPSIVAPQTENLFDSQAPHGSVNVNDARVEALLKEIDDLKKRLAERSEMSVSSAAEASTAVSSVASKNERAADGSDGAATAAAAIAASQTKSPPPVETASVSSSDAGAARKKKSLFSCFSCAGIAVLDAVEDSSRGDPRGGAIKSGGSSAAKNTTKSANEGGVTGKGPTPLEKKKKGFQIDKLLFPDLEPPTSPPPPLFINKAVDGVERQNDSHDDEGATSTAK